MNRRQKKKAYKKKYGYNPPKTEVKYHAKYWGKVFKRMAKTTTLVAEAIKSVVPIFREFVSNICNIAQEYEENIKTMSDEEFDKLMEREDLDAQTKSLAWRIRMAQSEVADSE